MATLGNLNNFRKNLRRSAKMEKALIAALRSLEISQEATTAGKPRRRARVRSEEKPEGNPVPR
jgi:hypothetical protein